MSLSRLVKLFALTSAAVLLYYILVRKISEVKMIATNKPKDKVRYILDWRQVTDYEGTKLTYCPMYPNCFYTDDRQILPDLRDFDVILFRGFKLPQLYLYKLPQSRSPKQKYIFSTMESANDNPICDPYYDEYFNWTWTYRLDSDLIWAYFIVYDHVRNIIAPKVNVTWLSTYKPINDDLRRKLSTKKKAAVWFVSHCKTSSKRENFVKKLSKYMNQYNMNVDVYGKCGSDLQCVKGYWYCDKIIQTNYYFFFSFENSFDEDYVTEKVLTAVKNFAVPVVYGGADYSRFLPPGSYLDARQLGAELLASTMRDIIQNHTRYEDMFRWRNHYQITEPFMTDVCNLCAKLNDPIEQSTISVYSSFRNWWNKNSTLCKSWHRRSERTV